MELLNNSLFSLYCRYPTLYPNHPKNVQNKFAIACDSVMAMQGLSNAMNDFAIAIANSSESFKIDLWR